MSAVDFILNVVGLLLWLNWRAVHWNVSARPGIYIVSMLKRTAPPPTRWFFFLGLIALLFIRAFFYWQIGEALHWIPGISLGRTTLSFRSDLFGRMLLFSIFSFAIVLAIFHLWLLLLSFVNADVADDNPQQKLVRLHLGLVERWPNLAKLFLPLLAGILIWLALNPLLLRLEMVPKISLRHLLEQGALIGFAVYLALKFLIVGFLALHLLNSYVYLGEFAFWQFINFSAQRFLSPLKWLPLRIGKIDFVPALAIALVLVAAEFAQRGLTQLYLKLPF